MAQYTKPYGDFNVFSKKLQQRNGQTTVIAELPPKDNAATDRQLNVKKSILSADNLNSHNQLPYDTKGFTLFIKKQSGGNDR